LRNSNPGAISKASAMATKVESVMFSTPRSMLRT
jgi:hypothetical protein